MFRWLSSQNLQHFLIEFLEEVLQQNKDRNKDGRHRIQETGALPQMTRNSPGREVPRWQGCSRTWEHGVWIWALSQEVLTWTSPGRKSQCSRKACGLVSSQENKNSSRYFQQSRVCNQGIALKSIESNLGFPVQHISPHFHLHSEKKAKLKNQQLFLEPLEYWGHRQTTTPKSWRDRQADTGHHSLLQQKARSENLHGTSTQLEKPKLVTDKLLETPCEWNWDFKTLGVLVLGRLPCFYESYL